MSEFEEGFLRYVLMPAGIAVFLALACGGLVTCGREIQADAACQKKHCDAGMLRTRSGYECVCLERAK